MAHTISEVYQQTTASLVDEVIYTADADGAVVDVKVLFINADPTADTEISLKVAHTNYVFNTNRTTVHLERNLKLYASPNNVCMRTGLVLYPGDSLLLSTPDDGIQVLINGVSAEL